MIKSLRYAFDIGFKAFCFQECVFAAKYYWETGLGEHDIIHGLYRFRWIPGPGQYLQAPLWELDTAVIKSPSLDDEFTIRHEVGHSTHPFRLLHTIAVAPLFTKLPGWQALAWLITVNWIGISVSERLAELYALQHCSLKGLKAAFQHFDQAAQDPTLRLVPDTHASNAERAYAIRKRIAQLEAEPNKAPTEIPITIRIGLGLL